MPVPSRFYVRPKSVGKRSPVELDGRPKGVVFTMGAVSSRKYIDLVVSDFDGIRIVCLKRRTRQGSRGNGKHYGKGPQYSRRRNCTGPSNWVQSALQTILNHFHDPVSASKLCNVHCKLTTTVAASSTPQ